MRTVTHLGLNRVQADRLRKASVYVNIVGFCFFVAGYVVPAASIKFCAEAMRLSFFEHVGARDMTCLGLFFMAGSLLAVWIN